VSHNERIFFVHYSGEMKEERVKNLNVFTNYGFMDVSITNVRNKHQQRVFWAFIDRCT